MIKLARLTLGALLLVFAVGTVGVSSAVADEKVNLVFQVEGMT
jgi:hypothetical protein